MAEKRVPMEERRARFFDVCEGLRVNFKEPVKIFAIDAGRVSCGWAAYSDRPFFGSVVPGKQRSSFRKVVLVTDEILALINEHKPNFVLMEDYAYGMAQGREMAGEIQGCIMYGLAKMDLPLIKPAPSQLKNFVNAQAKSKIMMNVLKKYHMSVHNADEADAFVLAMIGKAIFDVVYDDETSKLKNDKSFIKNFYEICKGHRLVKKQADVVFSLLWRKGSYIWL